MQAARQDPADHTFSKYDRRLVKSLSHQAFTSGARAPVPVDCDGILKFSSNVTCMKETPQVVADYLWGEHDYSQSRCRIETILDPGHRVHPRTTEDGPPTDAGAHVEFLAI